MSTKPLAAVLGIGLALAGAGASMAACVGDDPAPPSVVLAQDASPTPTPTATTTTPTPTALAANGATCSAGTACTSGYCVDGVCCESACAGDCERCDLAGSLGSCEAVPEGQDPDNDCPTEPITEPTDAGAPSESDAGGEADAGADAAVEQPFVNPDGGLPPTIESQCAGKCNGKRKCAYPGKERTCGTTFCGNSTTQGRASCDGAGHCFYGREECSAYHCPDGQPGCKTSCVDNADCQPTHYCDGVNGCKPKLNLGTVCTAGPQCGSGFCRNSVCCDSPCDTDSTFRCDLNTGSTKPGQCSCGACATGPCALFYADNDGDGYGSKSPTAAKKYECATYQAAGWSKTNTDCYDGPGPNAAGVHPGAGFQSSSYTNPDVGVPSYDWDCSDTVTEEWPEAPRETCHTCYVPFLSLQCVDSTATKCSGSSPSGHGCATDKTTKKCGPTEVAAFRGFVSCGGSATLYTCGKCSAGTLDVTTKPNVVQRCK